MNEMNKFMVKFFDICYTQIFLTFRTLLKYWLIFLILNFLKKLLEAYINYFFKYLIRKTKRVLKNTKRKQL